MPRVRRTAGGVDELVVRHVRLLVRSYALSQRSRTVRSFTPPGGPKFKGSESAMAPVRPCLSRQMTSIVSPAMNVLSPSTTGEGYPWRWPLAMYGRPCVGDFTNSALSGYTMKLPDPSLRPIRRPNSNLGV